MKDMKFSMTTVLRKVFLSLLKTEETAGKTILEGKAQQIQARKTTQTDTLSNANHEPSPEELSSPEDNFLGKMLAAAYHGLTGNDLFNKPYPQERRNAERRNRLSAEEVERLHNARKELRSIRPKA